MMRVELLQPDADLEFGNGDRCPDMRFGIGHYGTFDFADAESPARQIKLGFVGTEETIGSLIEWLEKCSYEIPGKPSKQPRLYPPFPGYAKNHSFHSTLVWSQSDFRTVSIPQSAKSGSFNEVVKKVVDLYVEEIDKVIEKSGADVVMCAPPLEHLKLVTHVPGMAEVAAEEAAEEQPPPADQDEEKNQEEETTWYEFHDLLKAKSLHLRTPLQYILPATYDESKLSAQRKLKNREHQDEATRAWNLFTAIYYKARGIPWRMTRDDADVRTCYLGISFFRTLDKKKIYASSAQVFNERGEGVIVRGGIAYEDKDDRTIHLDENGAYNIIKLALDAFKGEHGHYPARVVLHKTSSFTKDENDGFMRFLKEKEIEFVDFLYLRDSYIRLYRPNVYPPLRGTLWHLEDRKAILYTKGSVPFYETYPGTYPPKSLYMDCEYAQRSVKELARECMALSKMNWNNTRFDGQFPITLRAARQVGLILKYLEGADTDKISPSYRFYM
jgi:hypothetical protein